MSLAGPKPEKTLKEYILHLIQRNLSRFNKVECGHFSSSEFSFQEIEEMINLIEDINGNGFYNTALRIEADEKMANTLRLLSEYNMFVSTEVGDILLGVIVLAQLLTEPCGQATFLTHLLQSEAFKRCDIEKHNMVLFLLFISTFYPSKHKRPDYLEGAFEDFRFYPTFFASDALEYLGIPKSITFSAHLKLD